MNSIQDQRKKALRDGVGCRTKKLNMGCKNLFIWA
jgi:hypothetical protein